MEKQKRKERHDKILSLYNQGKTYREISELTGISKSGAHKVINEILNIEVDKPKTVIRNRWVSVKDELPTEKGFYLVNVEKEVASIRRGSVEISDLYETVIDGFAILKFQDYVTHWMSIPSPPQ